MKERLITLGLAIAAFAAFYVLLAPKPEGPQERPTRPTSIESGPNSYLGLLRWLTAERVPVVAFDHGAIADRIRSFLSQGLDTLIIGVADPDPRQLDLFGNKILPRLP